jgi:hypothetical protein
MTRVLFLTAPHEDYLADGLLHGLRNLLGDGVVDYPRADFLYRDYPLERRSQLYGRGFSLYGLLPEIPIDRHRPLQRARAGEFDLIVFADIWSSFGRFAEIAPTVTGTPLAVLDGADRVEPYPYAGQWWRKRAWWMLPRAHTRALYFKRELTPATGWYRSYLLLPPALAQHLPSIRAMREISFSFPAEKITAQAPSEKRELFARHVVDPEVATRLGRDTAYAFSEEREYYRDLQSARYGITVKRAGWDCLRHYELAANGCVPCFRNLAAKPLRCAPHGLDADNCVAYRDHDELMSKLARIDDDIYRALQGGALRWARASTTVRRAERFLADCGLGSERRLAGEPDARGAGVGRDEQSVPR